MLEWVRSVGRQNGFLIVITKSTNLKGNKLPRCILCCEKQGKYKRAQHLTEGQSFVRNTRSKKCECPFQLRGVPIPPDGVMWGVKVVHGIHNHETASYIDGHEFGSRLNELGKNLVHDLGNSTAPREIRSILQQKDPSNTTNVRTIYNAKYSNRVSKRNGLNPTQYALEQLVQKKYLHNWRTNPDTNEITDIIWVHPESLELYVNFPSVLVIDATYKTNEYRIPLLEVVGITSTMKTYSLMFSYLSNEKTK